MKHYNVKIYKCRFTLKERVCIIYIHYLDKYKILGKYKLLVYFLVVFKYVLYIDCRHLTIFL